MKTSVEVLAIILFGVLGLSHLLQPKAWVQFFTLLRGKGEAGVFVDGFLNLPLAGVIIAFHNVWSGIPAMLTLVGWCLLIKSLLRFCLPKHGLMMMGRLTVERSWEFRLAGTGLLVLAGIIGYGVALTSIAPNPRPTARRVLGEAVEQTDEAEEQRYGGYGDAARSNGELYHQWSSRTN